MSSFWETLQVNGQEMPTYVSVPSGSGPFPAVGVIQTIRGVNQFIQDQSDKLAAEGYAAVAPDLFHRITDPNLTDPYERGATLSDPEVVADCDATMDFLLGHSAVDNDHIGIVGFCMGGRVAWLAAATNPHYKASVPYYGGSIMVTRGAGVQTPLELADNNNCPILFHFGEIDANPSQDDMAKLDAELTRLGKPHQFFSYPGADHGFADHTGARYHKDGAEIAWPRTLQFFAAHLKGAPVV